MKIEIDAKDINALLLKTTRSTSRKFTYSVWIDAPLGTHRVLKTENYQEAINTYQHLLGEMQS